MKKLLSRTLPTYPVQGNMSSFMKGVVKMKFYRTDKHLIGYGIPCYFYSFAVHYSKPDKK